MRRFNQISGRFFEEATLGCCRKTCSVYISRREAMDEVRKNQPPTKPSAARQLEAAVSRMLGSPVVFYTAVRSALDEFHSVDAFFETLDKRVVTIDVTVNERKVSGKADLIVQADDFEDLTALAGRIAGLFAPKQEYKSRAGIRAWRA